MPNFDFKFDQNDIPGSLEKLLKYMNWFTQHLDETNIKSYAWGDSQADNVDSTHKLKLKFYVPESIIKVQKLLLNFSIEAFRAYETGAASGGGSTPTSSSGGGSTPTSSAGSFDYDSRTLDATWDGGTVQTGETGSPPSGADDLEAFHDHSHSIQNMEHYHDFTPTALIHTHTVSVPDHTHDVSIPNHTHGISYGIYESTTAAGVMVYVDGVLRLSNGGAGYSSDQANLDLTEWVTTSGWHTIELSSTQLGRINAAYFIQIYAGANGI